MECRAWETYYQRRWAVFLLTSVRLVRAAFRMSWPRTLAGAWLVLRANQKWAPFPRNDPDAARALLARVYRLLAASDGDVGFEPRRAAALEVECWRAHRDAQHGRGPDAAEELVGALSDVYAYCYGVDRGEARAAAALRAEAMALSDEWVAAGCDARTGAWSASARCSCARTRRCWPRCTAHGRADPARRRAVRCD